MNVPSPHGAAAIAVIAIGNPYRLDDAAGPVVLAALQPRFAGDPRVRLVELDGEPVRIVQSWAGCDAVIIVDAVRSNAPAGTIHRFGADEIHAAAGDGIALGGGHLLGVADAIELARAMGTLPPSLLVIGIEGEQYGLGEGVGPAVAEACRAVAAEVGTTIHGRLQQPNTT
ncbi:MAG: hydrogenase maturation protease [Actinomycetota bacterium]|nr:hydrogenase maturation protease [Actinomycetota bacterium]